MNALAIAWRCLAVVTGFGLLAGTLVAQQLVHPAKRPNVLWIVADDMNWDSPGCFGGVAPEVTPNIDRLASEGMQFWHAHVNVAVCTPSRSVMLTGLYSQHNGAEGFQRIRPGTATLPAILNEAGFLCGTIGKPLNQQELFRWSVTYTWQGKGDEDMWGRDPGIYRRFAGSFFETAKASGQPFFLMASSHDPHSPFPGTGAEKNRLGRPQYERAAPSRTFGADKVRVPGFLPDLLEVRRELAAYSTAVGRLDEMVGAVLDELAKAGLVENTIVVFLSDHGMSFPSAKANCYVQSTRSPFIIRWPGRVKAGSHDRTHMVSAVDLQPTMLEAVGLPPVQPSDGRSFLPLLRGQPQPNRDYVFTQFFHIHGKDAFPMRAVLSKQSAYVFNPWSDGRRRFPRQWSVFGVLQRLAETDPVMAARVRHLQFRTVEEFYDLRRDPHCLSNLLASGPGDGKPAAADQEEIAKLRAALRDWMVRVEDPALPAFDHRERPEALEQFMQRYTARATREVEELRAYEQKKGYRF